LQPLPPPPVRRRSGFADEGRRFPATFALLALNVLVFVYEQLLSPPAQQDFLLTWALIPARLTGSSDFRAAGITNADFASPAPLTLLSTLFLHGSILHLAFNMFTLYGIGRIVEGAIRTGRFLLLYFAAGIGSSLACLVGYYGQAIPVVGASGAVYGLLAGYLLLLPPGPDRTRSITWILALTFVPALPFFDGGGGFGGLGQIAVWGHVGGFAVGFVVMWLFLLARRRSRTIYRE